MRAHAALEDRIAVVQHVLRRDRRGDRPFGVAHILRAFLRRDVLEHHLQGRERAAQRLHDAFHENRLAVEHIDRRVGHFTVHQQRHAAFFQGLKRLRALAQQVGDARIGVGRRARRIQLHGIDLARFMRAEDLFRRGVVGQIKRHQRSKSVRVPAGFAQRLQDPAAVGQRLLGGRHRRLQVRHDDGARELARGIRHHGFQRRAIAQVQVPVVGAGDGELIRVWSRHGRLLNLPAACPVLPARRTSRCPGE
ncbi:hypothetical protein D3C71_1284680 [compost metagenome]